MSSKTTWALIWGGLQLPFGRKLFDHSANIFFREWSHAAFPKFVDSSVRLVDLLLGRPILPSQYATLGLFLTKRLPSSDSIQTKTYHGESIDGRFLK